MSRATPSPHPKAVPADAHDRRAALDRAVEPVRDQLATPTLVIDLDAVEHNVAAMLRRVGDAGRWRPHVKTVKQATIVGLLLDAGVFRFKAATPAEVAMVLAAAAERALPQPVDVMLAYPAAPPQLRAMLALRRAHPHARLGLLADDPAHAAAMVEGIGRPEGVPAFDLWLDVDVGMHRTGSDAARWRAEAIGRSPWLVPIGLHGYDGHLGWDERAAAHAAYDALIELAQAVAWPVEQIVTSGTHSYAHALDHAGLREGRWSHQVGPGTLVLSDRRSAPAAADLGLRQAAFVLSRVVARPGDDRITLDAGSKAIAPDCPAPGCAVLDAPELEPLTASEEHRPVRVPATARGDARPARGSFVWLVPDHVCTTVNLHAQALYVRGDAIVGSASIAARGHRPWLDGRDLGAAAGPGAGPGSGPGADPAMERAAETESVGRSLAGRARPLLPALLALASTGLGGCQPIVTEIEIDLVLPPDTADLEATNNVSVVLEPEGLTRTTSTEGLDFALSFEVPPDGITRTLSVFLAHDDTLLAWGRTPPFSYLGATGGLSLLLTRPGELSPLDLRFATPDPDALIAPVADIGVLVLDREGGSLFLDAYVLELRTADTLPDPPAPDDGVLIGAADGGVLRVAWHDEVAAWRFDAVKNAWQSLELEGELEGRAGAAWWVDAAGETLWLLGGGERTDAITVSLLGDGTRTVEAQPGYALDGPRPGATAVAVGDGETLAVVGGDGGSLAVTWQPDAARGSGPSQHEWIRIACTPWPTDPTQQLCVGGYRDGIQTADGLRLALRDGVVETTLLPDLLPVPLSDPRLFPSPDAVFAQGDGYWMRIDVEGDTAVASEELVGSIRAARGHTATLATGTTLLVGGVDVDGQPLDRWLAFAPEVGAGSP